MTNEARETMDQLRDRAQNMDTRQVQGQATQVMHKAEELPDTVYLGAAIGSIVLSLFFLLLRRRDMALFVGLWPPTILNLIMVMKQRHPSRELGSMQNRADFGGPLMAE